MKSTIATALVCATMLAAGLHASAEELCRCWQENASVSALGISLRQFGRVGLVSSPNRPEAVCHTRCACRGLSLSPSLYVGGKVACSEEGWCLTGAGGLDNEDGTVSLFAGGVLSRRDPRGYPDVLAVGTGACVTGAGPRFEAGVCRCRQEDPKADSSGATVCTTRCRCSGVRGGRDYGDYFALGGALGGGERWRILGGGFVYDDVVHLLDGAELRRVDRRGVPTILAVGTDACT